MSFLKKLFGNTKRTQGVNADQSNSIEKIDLKKVYPRIKGIYDDENPDPAPKHNSDEVHASLAQSPVFKALARGIAIFYMIDKGNSFQIIQNKHLTNDITIDKLHDAALTNMAIAISDKTQVNGDPNNVMMVTNGGNFEATMLLADFFWEQIEPVFKDRICVAIPANDLLFIAAKHNAAGRENLRKLIKQYFENQETRGLIVRNIYERNAGTWTFVETA
jgi:uncharacterized protein YtpQ (UPF0354 family)